MHSQYNAYYEWFTKRPHFPFPENLLTLQKFEEFNRTWKGDKSDTKAYNLALCYNADAYKQLNEIK